MTTALWSAKHRQLGADKLVDSWITAGKIFPLKSGGYVTGAGYYDDIVEVAKWMDEGSKEDNKPTLADRDEDAKDSDFIYVDKEGTPYWLTSPFLRMIPIQETFYAVGSGGLIALGALEAGATVARALQIAAKYDPATGTKHSIISFPQPPEKSKPARIPVKRGKRS